MSKNLTELNYPCSFYHLSEILQQHFLLCFPVWLDSKITSPRGPRNLRFTKPFTQQRWVTLPPVTAVTRAQRMGRQEDRRCTHSDSHRWAFFDNNLPVWVMLTIIRQTESQTIVRKAVKHFVLLSPAQACDLSSHKKHIKKKISKQWHFVQITSPSFPDCL